MADQWILNARVMRQQSIICYKNAQSAAAVLHKFKSRYFTTLGRGERGVSTLIKATTRLQNARIGGEKRGFIRRRSKLAGTMPHFKWGSWCIRMVATAQDRSVPVSGIKTGGIARDPTSRYTLPCSPRSVGFCRGHERRRGGGGS